MADNHSPQEDQREALERAERKANRDQPNNYQAGKAGEKIVSTGRTDQHEAGAIDALDNDDSSRTGSQQKGESEPAAVTDTAASIFTGRSRVIGCSDRRLGRVILGFVGVVAFVVARQARLRKRQAAQPCMSTWAKLAKYRRKWFARIVRLLVQPRVQRPAFR